VPALFRIEVVAGLARRGHDPAARERLVDALLALPSEIVTLGPRSATRIARLAAQAKLRATGACYAWLALHRGLPLVTPDRRSCAAPLGGLYSFRSRTPAGPYFAPAPLSSFASSPFACISVTMSHPPRNFPFT
jgi:hypothetical protein